LRLFGTSVRKGWKRKVHNLNSLRLCSTRHIQQELKISSGIGLERMVLSCGWRSTLCDTKRDARVRLR